MNADYWKNKLIKFKPSKVKHRNSGVSKLVKWRKCIREILGVFVHRWCWMCWAKLSKINWKIYFRMCKLAVSSMKSVLGYLQFWKNNSNESEKLNRENF